MSSGSPPPSGGPQLPPELDPRGRRHARRASANSQPSRRPSGQPGRRRAAPRRTGTALHGLALGARIVAALLSLVVLVGSGWAWASYRKFNNQVATGQSLPNQASRNIDGADQNILLIGNDSRNGATPAELQQLATQNDGGSANTDTMILLHVPANGAKATLMSFPRDSWVNIPGYGMNRINAAYPDAYNAAKAAGQSELQAQSAGIALTAQVISNLTGLSIDHYLQVNLLGFYRISMAIGGVQVCLNQAQKDHYSGINLPAGVSTIEGTQALAFVRQRHGLPNGDLDRIKRQQYFLGAVFRKVSSAGVLLNPFKLNDLLNAVSSSLLKDPGLNLLSLANQVQNLQAGNVNFTTMQTTGNEVINGNDVLGVDPAAVQQQVLDVFGINADPKLAGAPTVAPNTVTVTVLNGGNTNGAAATNAQLLKAAGFTIATTGNAPATPTTVVEYPDGMQSQAKTLAAAIPGAKTALTSTVNGVTLILGANGVEVPNAASPSSSPSSSAPSPAPSNSGVTNAAGMTCIN